MNRNSIRHIDFKSRGKGLTFREKKRFPFVRFVGLCVLVAVATFALYLRPGSSPSPVQPIPEAQAADNNEVTHEEPLLSQSAKTIEIEDKDGSGGASPSTNNRVQLAIPSNAPPPSGIETINDAAEISKEAGNSEDSIPSPDQTKVEVIAPNHPATEIETPVSDSLEMTTTKTVTVKKGDSLAAIFKRAGAKPRDLVALLKTEHAKQLRRIFPGDKLELQLSVDGKLVQLTRKINYAKTLIVTRINDSFNSKVIERELERRIEHIAGTINSSLYVSAKKAGMSETMIMQLVSIFGWNIDFALDLRKGDSFSLIYESFYLDNRKIKSGQILAAEFTNRGRFHQAVRYTDPEGETDYFTPDGNSVRKAFIRKPLNYRRISSRFSRSRIHPLLGIRRPHLGVDFAARVGTPIKAAGDGKVIFKGRKGGYGRTLIIKHGSIYSTLYGHMSRFGRGLRKGGRVKQGQIIGYVGNSGMSTGPHLHYEFRINGIHKNPLTVKFPSALPIDKRFRKDFMSKSAPLIATLESHQKTMLAASDNQQRTAN